MPLFYIELLSIMIKQGEINTYIIVYYSKSEKQHQNNLKRFSLKGSESNIYFTDVIPAFTILSKLL